jgi:hypothetical protein
MKSGDQADVEAAILGPLLALRHVHAGDFAQVIVSRGAGHLRPQRVDWRHLKGDHEEYDDADGWSSGHVRSPGKPSSANSMMTSIDRGRT